MRGTQAHFAPVGSLVHNDCVLDKGNRTARKGAKPRTSVGRGSRAVGRSFVLVDHAEATAKLTKLSEIASERTPETIERALAPAKE